MTSEWFASTVEESFGGKHGAVSEVLCELPPKLTQRLADTRQGKQLQAAAKELTVHESDLATFPALAKGEGMESRKRRLLALRTASSKLEAAFEAFGRDRDRDDFQRLWYDFLQRHSPEALLGGSGAGASAGAVPNPACQTQSAIPTLLLSTNGASPADRLDLYGAFATYLREQQDAYVALLRPEDLAGGVGACWGAALAQLSGLGHDCAAEDVMGLVAWYEHETGRAQPQQPQQQASDAVGRQPLSAAAAAAVTPAKGARTPAGKGRGGGGGRGAKTPSGKTPGRGGRGGRGRGRAADADAADADVADADAVEETEEGADKENADGAGAGDVDGEGEDDGGMAVRLRARRAAAAGPAAAEAEARAAREAAAAAEAAARAARNARRRVVLLVEAAGRVADRSVLRALLAALHAERHRLPVVLVLGVSCPASLYTARLPADMSGLLAVAAAELAPQPQQLHRLFQGVLLSPRAASPSALSPGCGSCLLLLDGGCMRQLLLQSRLLEPSLAGLQAALLEAHEQHFRSQPLAALALLPLQHQQQAEERAAAAAAKAAKAATKSRRGRKAAACGDQDESSGDSSDSSASDSDSESSVSVRSDVEGDGGDDSDAEGVSVDDLDEGWLQRRRERHMRRLTAAVSQLPAELLRAAADASAKAAAAAAAGAAAPPGAAAAAAAQLAPAALPKGGKAQEVAAAVGEAFSALTSWRLGVHWMACVAERTGALRQGGGAGRYSLPALYVAAASPRLWRPPPAAMAMGAGGATVVSYGGAAGSASVGEQLLAGLLGPGAGGAAAGGGRGTLRALSEQEADLLLDELAEVAAAALAGPGAWMPSAAALAAARGLAALRRAHAEEQERRQGPRGGGAGGLAQVEEHEEAEADEVEEAEKEGAGPDLTSPVRRRLAAQGLTSPNTAQKLQRLTDRLGHLDPVPAPRELQSKAQVAQRRAGGGATAAGGGGGMKLPSSGQTQTKRQRDQALKAAVQQSAAAPAGAAAAAAAAGRRQQQQQQAQSLAERAAEWLSATLRVLLGSCPFTMAGSSAFTFRDAAALQVRLVGAPSLVLHTALTQPELFMGGLQPGLHPGQEDAALAYQLLLGCREGSDLRDWLADFCAASGLGKVQEVTDPAAQDQEDEEEAAAAAEADGPMGRSRHSKRRAAPRKRKAAPKQEVVLALDGPAAEAAVDALACRFEQAARELEAVGLCRFTKRRKGTYVQRTYFPPEALM
ncbi:hypothetical protein CHLRE_17g744247v5 [Chlamydomonas reinhardtii]|uniref:Origin recognition complex subunit 3 N-terminal domain-containing protein n=1 Tax=Chlamydomonas reinhardtii TaxID=3055 RepID=A0A2K3CRZ4_CHLRE|nr:uncharacterized protein CHLRE_17g744247v5 [Chlamydomonas reinhardtii]PNW71047.1 hypothetical protein CHLRE_17g744247v5 [Chlamydomonas reinhardtii]